MLFGYLMFRNFSQDNQPGLTGGALWGPQLIFTSAWDFLKLHPWWSLVAVFWVLVSVSLWIFKFPGRRKKQAKQIREWSKDLRRDKIDRVNATLLVLFVVVAFLLALSGFGHEITYYIWHDPGPRKQLIDYVAKAGGWAALFIALGGSIFTAIKTSPTGGHDRSGDEKASESGSIKTRMVFPDSGGGWYCARLLFCHL
jgi:hypothetical protein